MDIRSFLGGLSKLKLYLLVGTILTTFLISFIAYQRYDARQDLIKDQNVHINERIIERNIENEKNRKDIIDTSDHELRNSLLRSGEGSLSSGVGSSNLFKESSNSYGQERFGNDSLKQQEQNNVLQAVCPDGTTIVLYDFSIECEVINE